MRKRYEQSFVSLAALVGCAVSTITPALAQLEPKGIPLGGFRLFPSVNLSGSFDDNVYRTASATKSSYYISETPAVRLESDWLRHSLNVYGSMTATQYLSLTSENHNDWTGGADGRVDITQGLRFTGGGDYQVLHETRTSPDQPGYAKNPTEYALPKAQATLDYRPYHFGFSAGGNFERYEYSPTQLIGLPDLDNHDRDRDAYTGFLKAEYEFSPGYATFFRTEYQTTKYDLRKDRSGLNRDSQGYRFNAGLDMLVTDLIKGQVFVGYMMQNYEVGLQDVSGFNYGANLDWSPSAFWQFNLTGARTLYGTTIAGASAQDEKSVALTAAYFVLPTVSIIGGGGYRASDFPGTSRHDTYTDAHAGVNYFMNRYVSVKLEYQYQNRASNIVGQKFSDNCLRLSLTLHD